jgi:hypothetical protein
MVSSLFISVWNAQSCFVSPISSCLLNRLVILYNLSLYNLSYISLTVAWTVENMLFRIVLLTCGIFYHLTLLHATRCIALSEGSMLF